MTTWVDNIGNLHGRVYGKGARGVGVRASRCRGARARSLQRGLGVLGAGLRPIFRGPVLYVVGYDPVSSVNRLSVRRVGVQCD